MTTASADVADSQWCHVKGEKTIKAAKVVVIKSMKCFFCLFTKTIGLDEVIVSKSVSRTRWCHMLKWQPYFPVMIGWQKECRFCWLVGFLLPSKSLITKKVWENNRTRAGSQWTVLSPEIGRRWAMQKKLLLALTTSSKAKFVERKKEKRLGKGVFFLSPKKRPAFCFHDSINPPSSLFLNLEASSENHYSFFSKWFSSLACFGGRRRRKVTLKRYLHDFQQPCMAMACSTAKKTISISFWKQQEPLATAVDLLSASICVAWLFCLLSHTWFIHMLSPVVTQVMNYKLTQFFRTPEPKGVLGHTHMRQVARNGPIKGRPEHLGHDEEDHISAAALDERD